MKWDKEKVIEKLINLEKDLGRKPCKRDYPNLYTLSRKYFGTWNNMMKEAGYEIKYLQIPTLPKKDKKLYYFLGLLITDGHIAVNPHSKNYQTKIYTSYEEEKKMLTKLIGTLFSYNPSIRIRRMGFQKRDNFEIYISSKKVCEFLVNEMRIPSGAKSLTVKVPPKLFKSKNSTSLGLVVLP